MTITAESWYWLDNEAQEILRTLGPTAFAVYCTICKLADSATRTCTASAATIGSEAGLTARAVRKWVAVLSAAGYLVVTARPNRPNRYTVAPLSGAEPRFRRNGDSAPATDRVGTTVPSARNGRSAPVGTTVPPLQEETSVQDEETSLQEGKRSRKNGKAIEPAPIPEALDTPEFRAAWSEWLDHRRELKSPATTRAQAMQLKQIAEMGPARAVRAIERSIANGWKGIFEATTGPRSGARVVDRRGSVFEEGRSHAEDVGNI